MIVWTVAGVSNFNGSIPTFSGALFPIGKLENPI